MNRLSSIPPAIINAFESNPPAEIQSISVSAKVARLQERFKSALLHVATQRKEIYEVILDLKEHFEEYGFDSPAAAVESVCQRSKSWANNFVAEVEAELHVHGKVLKWPEKVATRPDSKSKEQEETLKQVAKLADPTKDEEEKPAVHSADEKKREEPKPRSNGKPVSCHHVWRELEELLGKCLNRVDEANRVNPNSIEHNSAIADIKQLMAKIRRWSMA